MTATQLLNAISNEVAKPTGELWLVLLGHGTFDGHAAKFNLRGPDLSAEELGAALKPCRRPLAVIQCASSSGPFLKPISGPGRVVITATRSGYEVNCDAFSAVFLRAPSPIRRPIWTRTARHRCSKRFCRRLGRQNNFIRTQGRLMTEHALLDDNGDGLGTPPDWFRGLRAVEDRRAKASRWTACARTSLDVLVRGEAEQKLPPDIRARRDELEQKLSALRTRKAQLKEDDYYHQLEEILVETARIYQGK